MTDQHVLEEPRRSLRDVALPGAIAGLAGGVAMAVVAMALTTGRELGLFDPLRLMSAVALGEDATEAGLGAVLLGLVIHLVVAAMVGVFFAWFLPEDIFTGSGIAMGVIFAAIIYAVMSLLVVPRVNPVMHEGLHHGWFFVEHLVYGLTVGLLIKPMRRALQAAPAGARQAA